MLSALLHAIWLSVTFKSKGIDPSVNPMFLSQITQRTKGKGLSRDISPCLGGVHFAHRLLASYQDFFLLVGGYGSDECFALCGVGEFACAVGGILLWLWGRF